MIRRILAFTIALLPLAVPASHLTEAEVVEMEKRCEALRQEKLAPEKAAVRQECLAKGEMDSTACEVQAASYGETKTGAIFRPGKYYDLPECEESYRARKHFDINPGR